MQALDIADIQSSATLPLRPGGRVEVAIAVGIILLACIAGYAVTFAAPALLDDQVLLFWLSHLSQDPERFLSWRGPELADSWGILTTSSLIFSHWLGGGSLWVFRLSSLSLHFFSSVLILLILRRLSLGVSGLPLASAVLFALYPLNAEALSWIGGRGQALGSLFFLGSIYLYLRAASASRAWLWTLSAALSYASSLMCSTVLSAAVPVILCARAIQGRIAGGAAAACRPASGAASIGGAAIFLLMAGVALMADRQLPALLSHFQPAQLILFYRHMLFPINELVWHGYAHQYRFLYFVLPPLAVCLALALGKSRGARLAFVFAVSWLLPLSLGLIGTAMPDSGLYGSRWLYFAAPAVGLLMALSCCSFGIIFGGRWRQPALGLACAFFFLVAGFYWRHLFNQNLAWRNAARLLAHIQHSAATVAAKHGVSIVIAKDVPSYVALSPKYAASALLCLDAATALPCAPGISGGFLKDALRQGQFLGAAVRWDRDIASLLPLTLEPAKDEWGTCADGASVVARMYPTLPHLPIARFDAKENSLVLETNSEKGPAVTFTAQGLSPIGSDFLFLDALIKTPRRESAERIEFYWLTRSKMDYDQKERKETLAAQVNDGRYHRYHIPLRSVGFLANGMPIAMTFGFPPGAQVRIKAMGSDDGASVLPRLAVEAGSELDLPEVAYPFVRWRQMPALGIAALNKSHELTLRYDVSKVKGAQSVLVEIADLNDKVLKRLPFAALSGIIVFDSSRFTSQAVYKLSLFALDGTGKTAGCVSDKIFCLVCDK